MDLEKIKEKAGPLIYIGTVIFSLVHMRKREASDRHFVHRTVFSQP